VASNFEFNPDTIFLLNSYRHSDLFREPLIKWERHLLEVIGPYFKARAKRQYPQRSCPSEQRRKTAQALPALRAALKRGRGLRWPRSHSP
jgi:hypothetical protein